MHEDLHVFFFTVPVASYSGIVASHWLSQDASCEVHINTPQLNDGMLLKMCHFLHL